MSLRFHLCSTLGGLLLILPALGCTPPHGAPTTAPAVAAAPLSGPWLVTLHRPDGTELAVRMQFETHGNGRWEAHSRPGAMRQLLTWREAALGQALGKLPPRGAVMHIRDGTAEPHGDSVAIHGTLASPFLGEHTLRGFVAGGRLRGELRRGAQVAVTGRVKAVPDAGSRPVRNYPSLAASIRRTFAENLYDPLLVEQPKWREFFRELDRRFAAARDDADAMAAFYGLLPRLQLSHVELFRNPTVAATPLDSLVRGGASNPDALVTLSFPAPGVAQLRVSRWNAVTPAVHRAFARIDSAGPHTLILDVRGNPGGDVSSMSPAMHLLRDTTPVGVFLGPGWYRAHRQPPTPAELATLPVLAADSATAASVVFGVREHGALVGRVPPAEPFYGGTVFLLIDSGSASASEPLAHLLRTTGRATLIGERTEGAMLSGIPHPVGEGWALILPVADYFTADGVRLEGVGVAPHIRVPSNRTLAVVAQRMRSHDPYTAALLQGAAEREARNVSAAAGAYLAAARMQPDSAAPWTGMGYVFQQQELWENAFRGWGHVLARSPADPVGLYQTGRTAALSGQHLREGEAALRRYLALPVQPGQPSHAAAHWRLGMIREAAGDPNGARREYESAVRLEPANADFQAALSALAPR